MVLEYCQPTWCLPDNRFEFYRALYWDVVTDHVRVQTLTRLRRAHYAHAHGIVDHAFKPKGNPQYVCSYVALAIRRPRAH